jgi:hypothetical protein
MVRYRKCTIHLIKIYIFDLKHLPMRYISNIPLHKTIFSLKNVPENHTVPVDQIINYYTSGLLNNQKHLTSYSVCLINVVTYEAGNAVFNVTQGK